MCLKSYFKEIVLKLATNGQSDKGFLLTSTFVPNGLSAPALGLHVCTCIKALKYIPEPGEGLQDHWSSGLYVVMFLHCMFQVVFSFWSCIVFYICGCIYDGEFISRINEPCHEKYCFGGLQPGKTQINLLSHRS